MQYAISDKRPLSTRQSQARFRMDVVSAGAIEYDSNTHKHVFAHVKASSHSEGHTSAKVECEDLRCMDVIDISFQLNRDLAVLLHDERSKTDVVTLYSIEDIVTDKVVANTIERQSLTHPIQKKSRKIEWSKTDPDVLAVGCADGVLVWHTRTRMPIHSFRNALLGIATFHGFSMGHSVDVVAFTRKVSGYLACASTTSGVIKVFSLTDTPSTSCIGTIAGAEEAVEQIDWSTNDTFLAIRYTESRSVNIFDTSNWSKQTWMFRESSVQHIEWFDEHNVEKLLVVTETTLNILRFVENRFSCQTSVQVRDVALKGSSHFQFHRELQTLVTIHNKFCAAHSVTLAHSEQSKIDESDCRTRRKKASDKPLRLTVFLDESKRIKFLLPKILV